jgi:hypothetical protein
MSILNPKRAMILGSLVATLASVGVEAGQQTTVAYQNYPEIHSGWYSTGCCVGATIAEDIVTAPGTEGMLLHTIQMELFLDGQNPDEFSLFIFHHDPETGLPGELLGAKWLGIAQPTDFQEHVVSVSELDIRIPASRQLWIAIYAPTIAGGWSIAGTTPTIGATQNLYARNTGDGFVVSEPSEQIPIIDMMLQVKVVPEPCAADLNGDFQVDVTDLVEVITDWGCTEPFGPCPGDVNADGTVDVLDLVEVITEWGNCFDV